MEDMGRGGDGRGGMWEIPNATLWVHDAYSTDDVFLAHSSVLIHGAGEEIRILYLEGKDPNEAPHGWDHIIRIPPPFIVSGTTGVGTKEVLFLLGGKGNPREVRRLDLHNDAWNDLPLMMQGRHHAASVMLDPNTILVLGGWDPEERKLISRCECFDVRTGQWSPFPLKIPLPVHSHATILYDDHVYISGGWNGRESRGEVWKCSVKGGGVWDELPHLKLKRNDHGMMGFGTGGLRVIGGRHQRVGKDTQQVLLTETLTLDGEKGWRTRSKLPFINVWKAISME